MVFLLFNLGNWFNYGQKPEEFINSWRYFVDTLRTDLGKDVLKNVAFLWSPNSGQNFPWGENYTGDINKPYSPYYPGDDYVDWVGLSIYHYGSIYRWEQNVKPDPKHLIKQITGDDKYGGENFYQMYCVEKGKPFFLSETGATFHLSFWNETTKDLSLTRGPTETEPKDAIFELKNIDGIMEIKTSWIDQMFDKEMLKNYPKIKAISLFEFVKGEETTMRDFSVLGAGTPFPKGLDALGIVDNRDKVLKVFQKKMNDGYGDLILWANKNSANTNSPNPDSAIRNSFGLILFLAFLI